MDKKEIFKTLDSLLQEYEDIERDFYFASKRCLLEEGITYSISLLTLSDKSHTFKPLNMIKPFFVLFFENEVYFYKAKYKKRKVLTSFRGNMSGGIPLCLDDLVEFKIKQKGVDKFTFEGKLFELLEEFPLSLENNLDLEFSIKLVQSGESRELLERDLESHSYINKILEAFLYYAQSSRFVVSRSKQNQTNAWLAKNLNLPDYDMKKISMSHLRTLSKDILILEKIINSFRFGQLTLIDTKEISNYKEAIEFLMNLLGKPLVFKDTKLVLNCEII